MNDWGDDDRDLRRFERRDQEPPKRDLFDRLLAANEGEPHTKAATVTSIEAIPPQAQTYIIQTYAIERGFYGFVQMVDAEGRARIVLPPKVMAAIYRQRDALVKAGRSRRGKDRWANLTAEQKEAHVTRLRRGRKAS